MLRKFCKLCTIIETASINNLRKYSITSIYRNQEEPQYQDVFADDFIEEKAVEPEAGPGAKSKPNPLIKCKRKEFDFYPGTKFSKFEQIPIASKGWFNNKSKGDYFTIFPNPVTDEEENEFMSNVTFSDLDVDQKLIENIRNLGYDKPTQVQRLAIPEIIAGQNMIVTAETGCGKTLAYLIPIVQQILKWKTSIPDRPYNSPLAIIVTANRELTAQIGTVAKGLTKGLGIHVKTTIAGRTKKMMKNPSIRHVDILIGTVGILCKMSTWRVYKFKYIRHTVLDEAHALFHEAYDEKLKLLLERIKFGFVQREGTVPSSSQITLASATMPSSMPDYFNQIIDSASLKTASTPNAHRVLVPQKFWRVGALQKPQALLKLVKPRSIRKAPTLIFSKDASTSDWVNTFLNAMNVRCINLNGAMPAVIRKGKFAQFRDGAVHILSTTSSAARGLDTTMVDLIINYDFPTDTADYVHRCGRTGRVGGIENGRVINFITSFYEIELTQKIERVARRDRALPMFDIKYDEKDISIDQELKMILNKS